MKSISPQDVWELTNGGTKSDSPHIPIEFNPERKDAVRVIPLRKVKATIFWRPDFDDETGKWVYNKKDIDMDKVKLLESKMEEYFPRLKFKKKNGKQVHDPSCDYDPYDAVIKEANEKAEKK